MVRSAEPINNERKSQARSDELNISTHRGSAVPASGPLPLQYALLVLVHSLENVEKAVALRLKQLVTQLSRLTRSPSALIPIRW